MKSFLRIVRLIVIPFIIAVIIYGLIYYFWLPEEIKDFTFKQITTEEYNKLFYEKQESVVFITKENSEKKSEYEENIRKYFDGKYINVYYYDITNLTKDELNNLENNLGLKSGKYELPILVYTLNGDVYDSMVGYKEVHYIVDFINRNNIK